MTSEDDQAMIRDGCTKASWGCVDCKKLLLDSMDAFLSPLQARRAELDRNPDAIWAILENGNARALEESTRTMDEVKTLLNFD